MHTVYGFGSALGPGGCELQPVSASRPAGGLEQLSSRTREILDDEVVECLRSSQDRAALLLRDHQSELTLLAAALVERDTLTAVEVQLHPLRCRVPPAPCPIGRYYSSLAAYYLPLAACATH